MTDDPTAASGARSPLLARLAYLGCVLAATACQPDLPEPRAPQTSLEWVQASARVHDPAGLWSRFAAEVTVASVNAEGRLAFQEELYIDRGADTFRRSIVSRGAVLSQTAGPSGCTARWPGATGIGDSDRARNGLTGDPCGVILPRRALQEFLIGLPMSVLGAASRFGESPTADVAFGEDVTRVDVTFDDDPLGQAWFLFIDPDSKEMTGAGFTSQDGTGERFDYRDYVAFEGFRLAATREVFGVAGEDFVIEQRVSFEAIAP